MSSSERRGERGGEGRGGEGVWLRPSLFYCILVERREITIEYERERERGGAGKERREEKRAKKGGQDRSDRSKEMSDETTRHEHKGA